MEVEVIRDTVSTVGVAIPAGSVLSEVVELKKSFRGLWCSRLGSYKITVPKIDCMRRKEPA